MSRSSPFRNTLSADHDNFSERAAGIEPRNRGEIEGKKRAKSRAMHRETKQSSALSSPLRPRLALFSTRRILSFLVALGSPTCADHVALGQCHLPLPSSLSGPPRDPLRRTQVRAFGQTETLLKDGRGRGGGRRRRKKARRGEARRGGRTGSRGAKGPNGVEKGRGGARRERVV